MVDKMIHPYRYCKECGATTPFSYNFEEKEWQCSLCGSILPNPEDELPDEGKIRNEGKWNPLL